MNLNEIPDHILAVTTKSLDLHRQSLIRKLDRDDLPEHERKLTVKEISETSEAATLFRVEHDAALARRVAS